MLQISRSGMKWEQHKYLKGLETTTTSLMNLVLKVSMPWLAAHYCTALSNKIIVCVLKSMSGYQEKVVVP